MSYQSHKFIACPGGDLKVELRIHDTEKSLARAFGGKCWGFCDWEDYVKRDDPKVACRIHLCRTTISHPVIAHEVFHATTALRLEMGLPGHEPNIDEVLAGTHENITRRILIYCDAYGIKIQGIKLTDDPVPSKV